MSVPELSELAKLCIELEHWETPRWAADAILQSEILTSRVIDACVGGGTLSVAAKAAGYRVFSLDIHDWGYPGTILQDFLKFNADLTDETVFMNPPFSKAEEFVLHAFRLGARKVVCFQRFAWWESQGRKEFWDANPPARVYICGDRADCWRYDIKPDEKGRRYNPITGKKMEGTPTAHAWFVWQKGQPPGTQLHRIYKEKK